MTFTPINRTDDFTTISYNDLWQRCGGDREVIHAALFEGALTALLQVEGEAESRFYKVPKNHWRDDSILEGEPGQTLFCWGTSSVPAKFDNRPLLFFVDDVEEWEARRSAPKEHVPRIKFTTQAEVERWYNDRVATWTDPKPPSRDDDIAAGRSVGLPPGRVRQLRAKLAPSGWKVSGRRIGT